MFVVCWWVLLALVAAAVHGDIDNDGWVVGVVLVLGPREGLHAMYHHHHHCLSRAEQSSLYF